MVEPVVFIVDDDSFMRELLVQILGDAGLSARAFASASELLANADLQSPCVLLLDVRMPGMSGPELHDLLRDRGLFVPIIFLTGFADMPVAVTAMRNGALDFLVKPLDGATLVERVRQVSARFHGPDSADHARRLGTLTPREREVFDLMLTGLSSKRIAVALDCSFRTVDIHRGRVMTKMAAGSLAELVRMDLERPGATADRRA